uniref:Large ribosomal subunit protein bL9c n=1 Tax=Kalanchoe fedtschenkoi TaxID=63787 RepID=A0A7N0UZ93_KALFE
MAHMRLLGRVLKDARVSNSEKIVNPFLYAGKGLRYRKLEVILTKNMDKLGKAGQTVQVAPGYFRNYLMPKLLAVPNIDKFAYLMREQCKLSQPEAVEEVRVVKEAVADPMVEYQAAARRLANSRLSLRRYLKSKEELREPVTKEEIVSEVARQLDVLIEPENLYLPSPITQVGEFEVPLRLPMSIPLPEGKLQWSLMVKTRGKK